MILARDLLAYLNAVENLSLLAFLCILQAERASFFSLVPVSNNTF